MQKKIVMLSFPGAFNATWGQDNRGDARLRNWGEVTGKNADSGTDFMFLVLATNQLLKKITLLLRT